MPGPISIAAEHWLRCLSRIDRGEPVGDLENVLASLYLRELVRGASPSTIELTAEGRAVLAALDALPEARETERPRLVSRPLPEGWADYVEPREWGSAGHHHAALGIYVAEWETDVRAKALAVLALVDWLDHEAAVKAQDEVKP